MTYTEDFEEFWVKYPKRWDRNAHRYIKRKKGPASKSWCKLSLEIHTEILAKVKYIKQFEGSAVRDPVTWLNQEGWDDIDITPRPKPVLTKESADLILKPVQDEPKLDTMKINQVIKEAKTAGGKHKP